MFRLSKLRIGLILLTASPSLFAGTLLTEGFDNVTSLAGSGWVIVNNSTGSSLSGTSSWFQGNAGVFTAQSGADDSYIAADWNNASFGGVISNWLISPILTLSNGDLITFYTRTADLGYSDALELRLNTSGSSANVGSTTSSVGGFTTLLLSIGSTSTPYSDVWTQYTATVSGLSGSTSTRLAFHYAVSTTDNADYIGLDSVSVTTPEPASFGLIGLGLAGVILSRARHRAKRV